MNYVTPNGKIVDNIGTNNMNYEALIDSLKEARGKNLLSEETYEFVIFRIFSIFLNTKITKSTNYYTKIFNDSIENTFHHIG
jgi:hypothetical protein